MLSPQLEGRVRLFTPHAFGTGSLLVLHMSTYCGPFGLV